MKKKNPKPAGASSGPTAPSDLRRALAAAPKAKAQWMTLTPIARRDFINWINSAKQPETHRRRIEIACSKLVAGQRRPCCYAVVPMPFYKALGAAPKAKARWSGLTPDERRDFVDWIDAVKEPEAKKSRIDKACAMLAAGKRHP